MCPYTPGAIWEKGLWGLSRTSTEILARIVFCGVRPVLLRYPDSRAISVVFDPNG